MKIALIQMKGKSSNDDNIEIALEQIEKASASGAYVKRCFYSKCFYIFLSMLRKMAERTGKS